MIQYFKIAGKVGKFVEYDETTNRTVILVKSELLRHKQQLQDRINTADPSQPKNDKEWIAYGKSVYPYMDFSATIDELARVQTQIDAIKDL